MLTETSTEQEVDMLHLGFADKRTLDAEDMLGRHHADEIYQQFNEEHSLLIM